MILFSLSICFELLFIHHEWNQCGSELSWANWRVGRWCYVRGKKSIYLHTMDEARIAYIQITLIIRELRSATQAKIHDIVWSLPNNDIITITSQYRNDVNWYTVTISSITILLRYRDWQHRNDCLQFSGFQGNIYLMLRVSFMIFSQYCYDIINTIS